jgi:methylglyoxal synthase
MESIIVYRNPIEKMFWENDFSASFLSIAVIYMVVLAITLSAFNYIITKKYRSMSSIVLFFILVLSGMFTYIISKMLYLI